MTHLPLLSPRKFQGIWMKMKCIWFITNHNYYNSPLPLFGVVTSLSQRSQLLWAVLLTHLVHSCSQMHLHWQTLSQSQLTECFRSGSEVSQPRIIDQRIKDRAQDWRTAGKWPVHLGTIKIFYITVIIVTYNWENVSICTLEWITFPSPILRAMILQSTCSELTKLWNVLTCASTKKNKMSHKHIQTSQTASVRRWVPPSTGSA